MRLGLAALLGSLVLASGTQAMVTPRAASSLTIVGARSGDLAGMSMAVAGRKLIVGAPGADAVYVVSPGRRRRLFLGGAGTKRLAGGDRAGMSVTALGDVNGDGTADFAVGAPGSSAVYVVFGGKRLPASLDQLDGHGFEITGPPSADVGWRVAPAGDVNGDGLADVLVSARRALQPGNDSNGAVYVVYGKRETQTVNLAALGEDGFEVVPADFGLTIGGAIAGGADLNGDGRPDLAVGLFIEGDEAEGEPFVVFGATRPTTVLVHEDGLEPPALGWRMSGSVFGNSGNGAALAEWHGTLAVGAPGDGCSGRCAPFRHTKDNLRGASGTVYVVRGQTAGTNLNFRRFASFPGYRIYGAHAGDATGSALATAGDMNGDRVTDLVVGAPGGSSAYVVYGRRRAGGILDLRKLGPRGFVFRGAGSAGSAVAAGQLVGSRRPDLVVGAPRADGRRGVVYVVDPAHLSRRSG